MSASSAVASSDDNTGVTPLLTDCRGPRTECAGSVTARAPYTPRR
jgi:hypothetical protein